jgi:nucleotide-binding universal stress UspA family protein
VPDLILADAAKWGADLIVMGTHGRSGFLRMVVGSVAHAIVRASPVPVLLVRNGAVELRSASAKAPAAAAVE